MNNRKAIIARAIKVGAGLQEREVQVSELLAEARQSELDVRQILPRVQASTRGLSEKHLVSLAESISSLGVIEPIVVDAEYRLIAGLHRLSASRLLAEPVGQRLSTWLSFWAGSDRLPVMPQILSSLPERASNIPVHMLPFKSSEASEKALLIEIAENDKRRNYTRTEIHDFAQRLKKAGYRYSNGRPKDGEQALIPVLAATVGVSTRTVRRVLSPDKSVTRVRVSPPDEDAIVSKALRRWLTKCNQSHPSKNLAEQLLESLARTELVTG